MIENILCSTKLISWPDYNENKFENNNLKVVHKILLAA
jgi:hypothetical protein